MSIEWLPLPAGFKMSEDRRNPRVELHTFNHWGKNGYMIIKGSKSVARNERGEALFSNEQVEYTGGNQWLGDSDETDDEYDPDLPGNPDDYGDR